MQPVDFPLRQGEDLSEVPSDLKAADAELEKLRGPLVRPTPLLIMNAALI